MKHKMVYWDNKFSIRKLSSLLQSGGVIAGPSDTVPGLYAMPTEQGFLRLNFLKKRFEKPYLLLISSQGELLSYVSKDSLLLAEKIIDACWPGPLTIIFKALKNTPSYLCSLDGKIAFRMPAQDQIQQLLKEIKSPLFSTSANCAGEQVPKFIKDIDPFIVDNVDAIVVDESVQQTVPSTIIDVSSSEFRIVREGAYSRDFVESLFK